MMGMGIHTTIQTASIGIPDTLFLMLLALVVFGPRRLPEIGRQIGKLMYEFRKVSNDFKFQMEEELRASEDADRQKKLQEIAAASHATLNAPQAVIEGEPLELGSGAASGSITEPAAYEPAVAGEVRAGASPFPQIHPPASGETIAAQKPFRGRVIETEPVIGSLTEPSVDQAATEGQSEMITASETEKEAHHG
jgi:sec-independent protein translocase protein TatB